MKRKLPARSDITAWMHKNWFDYETATELAEAADAYFELPSEWLDDPDHWIWEEAMSFFE